MVVKEVVIVKVVMITMRIMVDSGEKHGDDGSDSGI